MSGEHIFDPHPRQALKLCAVTVALLAWLACGTEPARAEHVDTSSGEPGSIQTITSQFSGPAEAFTVPVSVGSTAARAVGPHGSESGSGEYPHRARRTTQFIGRGKASGVSPGLELLDNWATQARTVKPSHPVPVVDSECTRPPIAWACTELENGRPVLWYPYSRIAVDRNEWPSGRLAFYTELGHAFDLEARGHGYRVAFDRIMRLPVCHYLAVRQRPECWRNPPLLEEERFGMAYSYCAAGATYPRYRWLSQHLWWGYRYSPDQGQYDAVCALLRRAGQGSPIGMTPLASGASFDASSRRPPSIPKTRS